MDTTETTSSKNSYGSVTSILLIVVVLVAGAWYVWHKRIQADHAPLQTEALETQAK